MSDLKLFFKARYKQLCEQASLVLPAYQELFKSYTQLQAQCRQFPQALQTAITGINNQVHALTYIQKIAMTRDQGLGTCSPKYASENIYSTIKIQVVSCQPRRYEDFRYHILAEYFILLLGNVFLKDFEFSH